MNIKRVVFLFFALLLNGSVYSANLEMESKIPGKVDGVLRYASMKYWVEATDGKVIDLWPKEKDEQYLGAMIDKTVMLEGAFITYSDGSKYFEPKLKSGNASAVYKYTLKGSDNNKYTVYLNDDIAFDSDSYLTVEIKHQFDIPGGKVALLELNSGGIACPVLYKIIVAQSDSPVMISNEFGTCSDLGKLNPKNDGFSLSLPGNPAEEWSWDVSSKTVKRQ